MTAKEAMDVYSGHPFYITVTSLTKVDANLQEHHKVGEVEIAAVVIIYVEDERHPYLQGAHGNNSSRSVNGLQYKPFTALLKQMAGQEAVN